jgi:hypothetical protein
MFIVTFTGVDGQQQWIVVRAADSSQAALARAIEEYERLYAAREVNPIDWAEGITIRRTLSL